MRECAYSPFSGHDALCPKCGGRFGVKFQGAGSIFISQGYIGFSKDAPEWLLRTCLDCDFERPEMCQDTYPETAMREARR